MCSLIICYRDFVTSPIPTDDVSAAVDRLRGSSLGDELSFLLARTNALSLAAGNVALAAHGLRVRSYSVLALAASGERPSQRELADFLRLDPSQVVALIDDLQEDGLVERQPDPRDRRANVVVATDAGVRLHRIAHRSARAAEERLYSVLDEETRSHLAATLREVAFTPRD